jgi:hypothetical protein
MDVHEGNGYMLNADERVKILREAKPDSWIAFSADESRVVAYGDSYGDVVSRAEKAGENAPVVLKTPESWDSRAFLDASYDVRL